MDAHTEVEVHALRAQRGLDGLGGLRQVAGEHARRHVDHAHLAAELAKGKGQLDPDHTAADDGEVAWGGGQLEDALVGERTLGGQAGNGNPARAGAGGDHNLLGSEDALAALGQGQGHLRGAQQARAAEDQAEVLHLAELVGLLLAQGVALAPHLGQRTVRIVHTPLLGLMDERLRGHAADIGAVAADVQGLDHGHGLPKVGQTNGDGQPARAGPDDDRVKTVAHA